MRAAEAKLTAPQIHPPPIDHDLVTIAPVAVARMSRAKAVDHLLARLRTRQPVRVAFANAHALLMAMDDPRFAAVLSRCLVLNDGIGAEIGARVLTGSGFPDNLNGTDFIPALFAKAPEGTKVYLLGARAEIVASAAQTFAETYPHIRICGYRDGYFNERDHTTLVADINHAAPDILLVAMGNPKQEMLMDQLADRLDVPLALGVGALFDFTAGAVARAPRLIRVSGLEWVFRLLQEPRRLGNRYTIGILRYLWKIAGLRLRGRGASV